ncbi:MAG: hypothetical protein ACRDQD_16365 [Nocardioidaceae bacterium]
MKESTKRTLRTILQMIVALIVAVPVIVFALPADVQAEPVVVATLAWVAIVTKVMTALEDAGRIPAWLRDGAPSVALPAAGKDVGVELKLDDNMSAGLARSAQAAAQLGAGLRPNDGEDDGQSGVSAKQGPS